ncbi:MAG: DUF3175 domain-containing protein [Lysobacter sp.]|nr:DUF3175 domain-containing protein [Lysobacter sp.]
MRTTGTPTPDGTMATTQHHGRGKHWSRHVTGTSNALDLREGVFALEDPEAIARSLKRSAEHSRRRKADPYRSAMSMLTFYINRAGRNLPEERRHTLEGAKDALRELYHRPRAH